VTPTTAELLRWWFLEDIWQRAQLNFHPGQRQAILNAIVAHEVWRRRRYRISTNRWRPMRCWSGNAE
jgi:hypothetical protein